MVKKFNLITLHLSMEHQILIKAINNKTVHLKLLLNQQPIQLLDYKQLNLNLNLNLNQLNNLRVKKREIE